MTVDFEYVDYETCPVCQAESGYRCTDTRPGRWSGRPLRTKHSGRRKKEWIA
jgi:hypothetical protein